MFEAPGINLNFLKKEIYTGSYKNMRFLIEKVDDTLKAYIYPEPWCFEKTPEENKRTKDFPFSQEGLSDSLEWIQSNI